MCAASSTAAAARVRARVSRARRRRRRLPRGSTTAVVPRAPPEKREVGLPPPEEAGTLQRGAETAGVLSVQMKRLLTEPFRLRTWRETLYCVVCLVTGVFWFSLLVTLFSTAA